MHVDEIYTRKYLSHFGKWKFSASGNITYGVFMAFYFVLNHPRCLKENLF